MNDVAIVIADVEVQVAVAVQVCQDWLGPVNPADVQPGLKSAVQGPADDALQGVRR